MKYEARLGATAAIAAAVALGFALAPGPVAAGHEPGHEALMEETQRGPDVEAAHETMSGSEEYQRADETQRGAEVPPEHEQMQGSDVYEQQEGRPTVEPHE